MIAHLATTGMVHLGVYSFLVLGMLVVWGAAWSLLAAIERAAWRTVAARAERVANSTPKQDVRISNRQQ